MTDRNDNDQPTSSEDLVRRAREELFGGRRETGDAHAAVESSVTSADVESSVDAVDEYADFLRSTRGDEPPATSSDARSDTGDRRSWDRTWSPDDQPTSIAEHDDVDVPVEAQPTVLSDEELARSWDVAPDTTDRRSWDPTWSPGEATSYGSDRPVGGPDPSVLPPPATPARRSSGSGKFGGWIIGLVIFGGIALFNFFDNTTSVATLQEGDCIQDPGLVEVIENVEAVGCNEPHEVEVFAVIELNQPDGARFPGNDAVYESGMDRCLPEFAGYVGTSYETSVYWVDAWTPIEDGWDRGDREVLCVIYEVTDTFDIKTTTFSARNTGR